MTRSTDSPVRIIQEVYDEANHALRVSGLSGTYAPAASSSGRFGRNSRTSGNITINGTSWANLDTGIDKTLTGVTAGQVIEVGASFLWGNENVYGFLDVVSVVSGAPVKSWGTNAAENNATEGIAGLQGVVARYDGVCGSIYRAVEAGDLSDGSLTLRLRVRTGTNTNKTVYANTTDRLEFWAVNHG